MWGRAIRQGRGWKRADELGLEESGRKWWAEKFSGSDVLFFSGHHYGSPEYEGPGEFDNLDIKKVKGKFERAKLIMISVMQCPETVSPPNLQEQVPERVYLGFLRRRAVLSEPHDGKVHDQAAGRSAP